MNLGVFAEIPTNAYICFKRPTVGRLDLYTSKNIELSVVESDIQAARS